MNDARRIAVAANEASSVADEGWAQRRLASRQTVSAPVSPPEDDARPGDDKRGAERRREERRTGPAAGARVLLHGRNDEVKLLNLSARGAMVAATLAAEKGERIAIQFADCNPIHGSVRWARDGRIGIEFARQTALLVPAQWRFVAGRRNGEAPTEASQRPRPPRQPVLWECELYWGRGTEPARLRNISALGAMIDASKNIPVGTEVVLALRSAGTVSGVVRWCRSGQVGLKFEREFDLRKLLDPGKLAAGAASSRPGVLKPLYLETEMDPSSPWAGQKDKLRPQDFS